MVKPSKVYVVPGCCMLFKKDALKNIGLLDETTFLGWEEYIVAEKFFQNNFETYFIPQSKIYHKVGRDTDKIKSLEKLRIFLSSEIYFQKKVIKIGYFRRLLIRLMRFLIYNIMLIFEGKWRKNGIRLIKIVFGSEI